MKTLIVTIEGGGNIPPVLDTIQRLRRRNHEVYVLGEPWMKALAEEHGGRFISFSNYFTKEDRNTDIFEDWKDRNNGFKNVIFGPAAIVAEETKKIVIDVGIDLVIADVLTPGALIGGKSAGAKTALLFHMPEYLPGKNRPPGGLGLMPGSNALLRFRDRLLGKVFYKIFDHYLKDFNAIRQGEGLTALPHLIDLFHEADLRIIQTSLSFDIPLLPAPANVRYTGPVLNDPDWAGEWNNPWPPEDQRPLVVVSFSSTFQNQKVLIQRSIDALTNLSVRGLVTLGPAMEKEVFTIPDNVKVIAQASHAQIFPHAALVITHAGHGTVMRAIANEVPLICIPMGRDQNDNAAKVQFKGLGIRLSMKSKAHQIARAVERVLKNPQYKSQSKILAEEIRKDAVNNRVVEVIEELF
jgi:MGT family glycosyltransferase